MIDSGNGLFLVGNVEDEEIVYVYMKVWGYWIWSDIYKVVFIGKCLKFEICKYLWKFIIYND